MQPTLIDHVIFALVAIIYPMYVKFMWDRRERSKIATGGSAARLAAYRKGIGGEWLIAGVILTSWIMQHRSLAGLGLGTPAGWPFGVGMAVWVAYVILGWKQIAQLRESEEARETVRAQLQGDVALIIPRNDAEQRVFRVLGISAGICEEIAYRGFMFLYLMQWMPIVGAVLAGSVIFGMAHLYLGKSHVLRTGLVGLVIGTAYVVTGSLWVPILWHATVDVVSGVAGQLALHESRRVGPNTT